MRHRPPITWGLTLLTLQVHSYYYPVSSYVASKSISTKRPLSSMQPTDGLPRRSPHQIATAIQASMMRISNGDCNNKKIEELGVPASPNQRPNGFLRTVTSYFLPKHSGITNRQRLAKMGLTAALSYGFVSNMSFAVLSSIAWYIFSKRVSHERGRHLFFAILSLLTIFRYNVQTGLSPLAPGQWKGFLAVYAGFFVFNNIVRPLRMALAIAICPAFDQAVDWVQKRVGLNNKAIAVGITVFLTNVVGTLVAFASGVSVASHLAGVPVFGK